MTRRRFPSVVRSPEHEPLVPVMAYEHVKQCLQVALSRVRADAAVVTAADQYDRDRRRALAFIKGGAMRTPTRFAAAQLAAEAKSPADRGEQPLAK